MGIPKSTDLVLGNFPVVAVGTITRKDNSHPAAYALHHSKSDKTYVGSTEDLYLRVNQHKNALKNNRHRNGNLQECFNDDPVFTLAFVKTETKEEALEIEQQLLDKFMPVGKLLNLSADAYVAGRGGNRTESEKENLRLKATQQFASEEAREIQRQRSKELWQDPDYRRKQSVRVYTEEQNQQNREQTSLRWKDPIYRAKVMEARNKPLILDGVTYQNPNEAAEAFGITRGGLMQRIRKMKVVGTSPYTETKEKEI